MDLGTLMSESIYICKTASLDAKASEPLTVLLQGE